MSSPGFFFWFRTGYKIFWTTNVQVTQLANVQAEYVTLLGMTLDKRMPFCFTTKIRDNRAVVSLRPRRELMGIIICLQWWEEKEILGENVEDSLLLAKQATRQRARRQWAGIPWRCWPRRVGGVVRHPRRGRASRRGVIV